MEADDNSNSDIDLELEDVELQEIDENDTHVPQYQWVESKKYWYALFHVTLLVLGITVFVLLIISAPGLWKFYNTSPVECEDDGTVIDHSYNPPDNRFTFEDMLTFSPNYPHFYWIDTIDGEYWVSESVDEEIGERELLKYSLPENIVSSNSAPIPPVEPSVDSYYPKNRFPQDSDVYIISPDGQYILFGYDLEMIYRHSYFARWEVCEVKTFQCEYITQSSEANIRHIQWSNENKISYIMDNDLWIINDISNFDIQNQTIRVTNDGEYGIILNGASDWAYEEEVFESAKANYWSPDSNYLAFVKFHQESVPLYNFPIYHQNRTYPELYEYKYPCAGESSSIVSLWIYDIRNDNLVNIELPNDPEQYLSYLDWINNDVFGYQVLNRIQQQQKLYTYTLSNLESTPIISLSSNEWIDPYYKFLPINIGNDYNIVVMQPRNNFKHLILYDNEGNQIADINEGYNFDIEEIITYDEELQRLYYSIHKPGPSDLNIEYYSMSNQEITEINDGSSAYVAASFSPSKKYFAMYKYGQNIPETKMISAYSYPLPLCYLERNEEFSQSINDKAMPTRKYFSIPSSDDSDDLNAVMYLPPGFNEESDKKYPSLFYVYGGPDSQTVNNMYELGFWYYHSYLASTMGIIVVSVDNRGTCCKGQEFLKQTYLNLGSTEVEDQLSAMHYVSEFSYIDEDKMGIWGWSYGAYMSSRVVSANDPIVKAAISVSPVTDWSFYDNIYTERYMQTPSLNEFGYSESSVLNRASNIPKTSSYLLIHGTADDNVHFQNSADWVTALIQEGVNFQTMYFPDKAHSLTGTETRIHLWKLITRFLAKSFSLPEPEMELTDDSKINRKNLNILPKF